MPDEGVEAQLVERLAAIVRGAPSLMQVLTIRALDLPDWLMMSGAVSDCTEGIVDDELLSRRHFIGCLGKAHLVQALRPERVSREIPIARHQL
jgi:hypothetical protein